VSIIIGYGLPWDKLRVVGGGAVSGLSQRCSEGGRVGKDKTEGGGGSKIPPSKGLKFTAI
jgi:hypothetical protein